MNQSVANRNPYGAWYMTPGGLPSPVNDPGPAIARARKKLRQIREHPETEQPLRGTAKPGRYLMMLGAGVVVPTYMAWSLSRSVEFVSWWEYLVLVLPSVLLMGWLASTIARHHPRLSTWSPVSALKAFIDQFTGSTGIAGHAVVISADNDEFPRRAPRLDRRDRTNRYKMSDEASRAEYWREATFDDAKWQMLHLCDVRSAELYPDLAVIECTINVVAKGRSTFLDGLLTGFYLPMAPLMAVPLLSGFQVSGAFWIGLVILSLSWAAPLGFQIYKWSGGHAHQFRLRKLMVQVHGEWRVFNGELQGPEEGDLLWLVGLQPQE